MVNPASGPMPPQGPGLALAQTNILQIIEDEFKRITTGINDKLATKDAEIEDLKGHIEALNKSITTAQANYSALVSNIEASNRQLSERITILEARPATIQTAAPTSHAHVNPPEEFHGERDRFRSWWSQVLLFLTINNTVYTTARERVLYVCSRIRSPAYQHIEAMVDTLQGTSIAPELDNFEAFYERIQLLFGPVDRQGDAERAIRELKQKKGMSVEAYAAEFRRWSGITGWDERALQSHFTEGLQEEVRVHMIGKAIPKNLDELIRTASEVDSALRFIRHGKSKAHPGGNPAATSPITAPAPATLTDPNAMDLSRMNIPGRMSTEERERRRTKGLCFKCGKSKHSAKDCRSRFNPLPPAPSSRVATAAADQAPTPPSPTAAPTVISDAAMKQLVEALKAYQGGQKVETSTTAKPAPGF
jgi:hypothetical protein